MYVEVCFDIPFDQAFCYEVPEALLEQVQPGSRVIAPLGNKARIGFVAQLLETPGHTKSGEFKPILDVLDRTPPLTQELLALTRWISEYYLCSWGEAMKAAFPFPTDVKPRLLKSVFLRRSTRETSMYVESIQTEHPEEASLLKALLEAEGPLRPTDLLASTGLTPRFLKRLIETGWVEEGFHPVRRIPTGGGGVHTYERPELNARQQEVLSNITNAIEQQAEKRFLLHGVTGSGKTEIYLRAIERVLELGKTALVLVPEIGLTPQAADRYRSRFGDSVGILHSGLSWGERFDEWTAARDGRVRVVVGTRSAVFCPLEDLALIVVDEEHDGSYKQDDPSPRYHARDVAAIRAVQSGAVAVFGSATPSLESYSNARSGKYELLSLPERAVRHGLPELELIDMRGRVEKDLILSNELIVACEVCLDRGEQAILFLNRRGFSTNLICRHCGESVTCEKCSVSLVYHQTDRRLRCHHCGFNRPEPHGCPHCGQEWLRYKGVGTEQVVEAVQAALPDARVGRMDTDTVQTKGAYNEIFSALANREIDILVGTQMIAKGLDFEGVSLVGVISADMSLFFEEFRSAERTFGLLTQVAGRAGRGSSPGKVLIQTYCPRHYSIQAAIAQNYEAFFEKEMKYRKLLSLPPFGRLVNLRVVSRDEAKAKSHAYEISNVIRKALDNSSSRRVRILGPAECPIYRLRDKYRWQISLVGRTQKDNLDILRQPEVARYLHSSGQVRVTADVDPQALL